MTEKQDWVEVFHSMLVLEVGGGSEGYQRLLFLWIAMVKYGLLFPLRKSTERQISEYFQTPMLQIVAFVL